MKCGINKKWDKKYASAKEKPDLRTLKLIDMSSSVSFAFGCSIPLWAGEYILVHNTFCDTEYIFGIFVMYSILGLLWAGEYILVVDE